MLFSGLFFIFRFLPIFLFFYILTPAKYRNFILFAGSLIFYAAGEPLYVLLLLGELIFNYLFYYRYVAKRKKIWIVLPVLLDVAALVVFKFSLLPDHHLPLGISFYTFQLIAFLADEQKKDRKGPVRFLHFATYIVMFPQLVAGPIVQYKEVRKQLSENAFSWEKLEAGAKTFALGLSMKVLLANQIGTLWNSVQTAGTVGLGMSVAWLGAIAYTFQIYFDFFGYSLMAIGLGRTLGFELPENFKEPYSAVSFSDFWRRWHVTLGRWFKQYVYIPLGGSRKGILRTICNLLIVWTLTGIWHGAGINFLLWGLGFFLLLVGEKFLYGKILEKYRVLGHLYVILLLPVSWVIFGITDPQTLLAYLLAMAGKTDGEILSGLAVFFRYLRTYGGLLLVCLLFATPYPRRFWDKYKEKLWMSLLVIGLFGFACYEIAIGSSNPFLYFRF
ncbi:MAG: MBOAT family protein [Lachnospiraceae bacterium]|nr:MBOAT family protein [Lachnospiraceae bacterium]